MALFDKSVWDKLSSDGIIAKINGVVLSAPATSKDGDDLEIIAPDGMFFSYVSSNHPFFGEREWDYNNNKKVASIVQSGFSYVSYELEKDVSTVSIAPNRVYSLTPEEFTEFNKESKKVMVGGSQNALDYSPMIINAVVLPFKLDDGYYLGQDNIYVFDKKLESVGNVVSTDEIAVNIEPISIPKPDSFKDFNNHTIKIHLPFIPAFSLDGWNVFGEIINVKYLFNPYDGVVKVTLHNSLGVVFHDEEYVIAPQMPMPAYGGNAVSPQVIKGDVIKSGFDSGVYQPMIEIAMYPIIEVNENLVANMLDSGVLNRERGFVVVDSVKLEVNATSRELETINSLLSSGVYIK